MLYALYGSDRIQARKKLHSLVDSLLRKRPDATLLHFRGGDSGPLELDELIHGQGLFEKKIVVALDNLFQDSSIKEKILSNLKEIAHSENIFVVLEEKLDVGTLRKLEKSAEKIQEFKADAKEKKRFDIFSLTDALGKRDRKKLWVLYQKAKLGNISSEEIHGILFWQVKSMFIAESCYSAKVSGLNPFVFNKSKSFLKNYSRKELQTISSQLVTLYHNARRGIHDFDIALEKFILSV